MKQLKLCTSGLLLLFTATTAMAQAPMSTNRAAPAHSAGAAGGTPAVQTCGCSQSQPVNMLVCISSNLLKTLKREKVVIKQNPNHIYTIVDHELLPYVDKMRMAQSVLGRNAWARATPQQRQRFSHAFLNLVVRTYAGALDAYTDQGIRFFPIRGGVGNRQSVNVSSQIVRSEGPPVGVSYSLAKNVSSGKWQVYDMTVEGVSLLESFRSQIQSMFSQGGSIDQVTTRLEQHPTPQRQSSSY
ncbi:MAG: ABC transporter substrate-binding protein [Gammaproteobacteria bacterium]|nr:ABC transporter substrate-binding protein [Gammaproteobacteria bacterium]